MATILLCTSTDRSELLTRNLAYRYEPALLARNLRDRTTRYIVFHGCTCRLHNGQILEGRWTRPGLGFRVCFRIGVGRHRVKWVRDQDRSSTISKRSNDRICSSVLGGVGNRRQRVVAVCHDRLGD